jgi:hypothetical protein
MSITNLTPQQLRRAADLQETIQGLGHELNQLLGVEIHGPFVTEARVSTPAAGAKKVRKKFSAETRAKMAAAQRARWAAKNGGEPKDPQATLATQPEEKPKKRKISAAGKAAIAAAARARWAKVRAEQGTAEPKAKKKVNPALSKARSDAAKARWAKKKLEKAGV